MFNIKKNLKTVLKVTVRRKVPCVNCDVGLNVFIVRPTDPFQAMFLETSIFQALVTAGSGVLTCNICEQCFSLSQIKLTKVGVFSLIIVSEYEILVCCSKYKQTIHMTILNYCHDVGVHKRATKCFLKRVSFIVTTFLSNK